MTYAGAIDPTIEAIGSLSFQPWLARLWREHETALVTASVSLGLFAMYLFGFLVVLLIAPAQLARVGTASLDPIPVPAGNLGFVWGLLRKLWENGLLLSLCRNRRVRRAWLLELSAGRRKFGDLGKFARESFVTHPGILDAWIAARIAKVREALNSTELFEQRRVYVPLPVRVGTSSIVERPDAPLLQPTFSRARAVLCIVGGGGCGKSTLACAISKWAMADDSAERTRASPHAAGFYR